MPVVERCHLRLVEPLRYYNHRRVDQSEWKILVATTKLSDPGVVARLELDNGKRALLDGLEDRVAHARQPAGIAQPIELDEYGCGHHERLVRLFEQSGAPLV